MSLIVNMKIVLMICVFFYHGWGVGGLSSGGRCQVFVLFLNLLSYFVSESSECADVQTHLKLC